MNVKLAATWAISILLVIFVIQNLETVQVNFLLWTVQMTRAVMLIIVFAAGVLAGWLICSLRHGERRIQ